MASRHVGLVDFNSTLTLLLINQYTIINITTIILTL